MFYPTNNSLSSLLLEKEREVEGKASHAELGKSGEMFHTGRSFVVDAVVEGGLRRSPGSVVSNRFLLQGNVNAEDSRYRSNDVRIRRVGKGIPNPFPDTFVPREDEG